MKLTIIGGGSTYTPELIDGFARLRDVLPLADLDVLVTPLGAFDAGGQRLGRGGGFYDRTLQNWQQYRLQPVGYAHDCQQVDSLPSEEWDIPLPAVITPGKTWCW